MGRAMEIITDSTYPKLFKPSLRRLFLFVTSIARTNLEAEIIQRGGTLCSNNTLRYKPRRECLGKCNKLLGLDWACANVIVLSLYSSFIESIIGEPSTTWKWTTLAIIRFII